MPLLVLILLLCSAIMRLIVLSKNQSTECLVLSILVNQLGCDRPTATELLKHPFFKKAKDRKYLQQTLVAIGPSLETRVQKVRTTLC